ncbi:hypothetical protein ACRE_019850 [Hapsidospora chrysogenum ATCC 11550]|uniref:Uncharacterized protein n=1 Tax=Hapsidospora chrysogenum (strain ATCC 11550 / CBS 779.69 / DSM 880 / IAM 14645 / JCM 23072 / IMI 49137) TaxID=857340 RepID=A0A086TCR7_HAPC1|nr:hypothetical protein ACRE_019850 [Hapsidospora chrysogenum ATCC 11550]
MESSPIVRAHDHARAAAVATRHASDTTVAINEHTQAAGEFASAATTTSSVEALRMLRLLEDHHRKLASLLSLPTQQPPPPAQSPDDERTTTATGGVTDEKGQPENDGTDDDGRKKEATTTATKASQKPGVAPQRRIASREMSSSIASNLASARGIRSKYRGQPLTPSVSNDQAPGNLDAHPRRDGSKSKMQHLIDNQSGKPSWIPPQPASPSKKGDTHGKRRAPQAGLPAKADTNEAPADDAGYSRFYNTFGDLINKISAPLAFAGLPLIQEESTMSGEATSLEQQPSSPTKRRQTQQPPHVSSDPDLSKIYSRATMRALTNEGYGASESFYVVPTSGHTMSYASILSYAEKEKRRLGASTHSSVKEGSMDDDEDFVDARETPVPPLSDGAQRRVGRARTEKELNNTIEELYTENRSLKDLLDKLTKRLHAFEASAQNMAESYRLMRPTSPLSTGAPGAGGGRSRDRQAELEEELATMKQHAAKLEKDNKKMQKTLEMYREKWEMLKAGAKARRSAQGGGESVEEARPG